ncbi:MAG: hypothetical protein COB66_01280 [Coxiella sp. (in: Bacteria)]|nr:MAG: hypothetical protein COB66_01280 [Coxiella sp. (in: g-proteobacteria)]
MIFNTDLFTEDLAAKSFAGMITRLMPNGTAPLFAMTSMMGEETAVAVEHGFFTKTMIFPELKINKSGGYTASETTFTADSTTNLLPGMIMRIERTGENVIINSVPTTTTVTVERSVGSVAAAAINDDDDFFQVGNAYEEASVRPASNNIIPVRVTNLTQIFRNTWGISGSAKATSVIAGESTDSENKQDAAALHASDIEKMLFFGQKSQSTRNGQPFRTADGLINIVEDITNYPPSYAAVNSFTAGATTNWTQLEGFLDPVFDQTTDPKAANERALFVGGAAKVVLNNIGRLNGTYQLMDGQTNFGLQFSTLTTSRGKFRIIEHPLFNSNPIWSKMAVGVDLPSFKLAYLQGRQTQELQFNTQGNQAQDNGIDAVGGTLTTECTTVVKNPPANVIIRNLTLAAEG